MIFNWGFRTLGEEYSQYLLVMLLQGPSSGGFGLEISPLISKNQSEISGLPIHSSPSNAYYVKIG